MFSHSLTHILARSDMRVSKRSDQNHLRSIQNAPRTICQGFSISGAPLGRWWQTSLRTDLSSPSGAVSYFGADLHFRSCLLQLPQILSPIAVWFSSSGICGKHMSLVCSPGRRTGEGVAYVVALQPMSRLLFKRQASCFWHQEHVPQFCCWKQCPGNSVPNYLGILLSLCSTFLLVLTHMHFHSYFHHANLNISYKSLLRKQTKLHFPWVNPFSIKLF